ncbi:MucR family transcriptional regulator [Paractinoplanes toevensis]|uniref:ROS/MUCR transcriptional regulator protein n=1 Tax=Paractinoplanes toevensis TaxID=571911 RepID=A0A919TF41_9ACTN|nr:MucR family transcriptional regulator [Actinoplanes toevensis]GIM94395.1 hypothetical protein Ato02nite_061880 [Actinoplanes toevensis]
MIEALVPGHILSTARRASLATGLRETTRRPAMPGTIRPPATGRQSDLSVATTTARPALDAGGWPHREHTVATGQVTGATTRYDVAVPGGGAVPPGAAVLAVVRAAAGGEPDDGLLVCRECGRRRASLRQHVARTHGMDSRTYRTRHGLAPDTPMVGGKRPRSQYEAALSEATADRNRARGNAVRAALDARARTRGYAGLEDLVRRTTHLTIKQVGALLGQTGDQVKHWRRTFGVHSTARDARRCQLCETTQPQLAGHVRDAHGLSVADYHDRLQQRPSPQRPAAPAPTCDEPAERVLTGRRPAPTEPRPAVTTRRTR